MRLLLFWDGRGSIVRFPAEIYDYSLLQVLCSMRIWDCPGIVRLGCVIEHYLHPMPRLRMIGAMPLCGFMSPKGTILF
jgi:hypothetical protein